MKEKIKQYYMHGLIVFYIIMWIIIAILYGINSLIIFFNLISTILVPVILGYIAGRKDEKNKIIVYNLEEFISLLVKDTFGIKLTNKERERIEELRIHTDKKKITLKT